MQQGYDHSKEPARVYNEYVAKSAINIIDPSGMKNMTDYDIYQSPFSWRYGSMEMRQIWSVRETRLLWRKIWVALAESQVPYHLVTKEQAAALADQATNLNLQRSFELEQKLKHDLMAELEAFGEVCPGSAGILHLGATSMDIKDNALVLQQKKALDLILSRLEDLLSHLADLIQDWAAFPLQGYTHLQPAEPTTLGYRLAGYGQDLLSGHQDLIDFRDQIKGKGFTGAVGTSASFAALLGKEHLPAFQKDLSAKLGLSFFSVTNQTYPRVQDFQLVTLLAGIGAALYRLAFDVRILQSPGFGELAEPFGKDQVGSSAMPFKQNPILSEKINSLGRTLAQFPRIAWDNAAHSLLERTLDDSANQRIYLPESFLCLDEMLSGTQTILSGLQIREETIQRRLHEYGLFSGTEILLMELSKVGADRQQMHKIIRSHALAAWDAIKRGAPNPIKDLLINDPAVGEYLEENQINASLEGTVYLGDAPSRAIALAKKINQVVGS